MRPKEPANARTLPASSRSTGASQRAQEQREQDEREDRRGDDDAPQVVHERVDGLRRERALARVGRARPAWQTRLPEQLRRPALEAADRRDGGRGRRLVAQHHDEARRAAVARGDDADRRVAAGLQGPEDRRDTRLARVERLQPGQRVEPGLRCPGDSSSSSVGARMPGANPSAAWSAIFRGSLPGGREGMNETDSEIVRAPERGDDEQADARDDDEGGDGLGRRQPPHEPPRARRRIERLGAPRLRLAHAGAEQPRSHRAHERGHEREGHTSVTTSAATARPGPKTRKKCSLPASSESAPAMTRVPAANTSGATLVVAHRAASSRVAPCRSRRSASRP